MVVVVRRRLDRGNVALAAGRRRPSTTQRDDQDDEPHGSQPSRPTTAIASASVVAPARVDRIMRGDQRRSGRSPAWPGADGDRIGSIRRGPPADVTFPGAHAPDRQYRIDAGGIGLAVYEWGDADAPPLLVRPRRLRLRRHVRRVRAAAGRRRLAGRRWDQRGHGDSEHAALYSWDADMRDAVAVFDPSARAGRCPSSGTPRAAR